MNFLPIADTSCQIGESPTWDAERGALLWCDIPAAKIFELTLSSGGRRVWTFDGPVGSFGLGRDGTLIVACGRAICRLDRASGVVSRYAEVEPDVRTRLNDGKVGPDGAFWVGSMDDTPAKQPIGSLYRVSAGGRVERKATGFVTSNGLAWSAGGDWMFHTDTRGPVLARWRFDAATGAISEPKTLATLTEAAGRPDGGATDQAGCYWSAGVTAGRLNMFDSEGAPQASHDFPVPTPTMPCFGGDDLRTLFVTSLRRQDATDALSGSIFQARVTVPGVPIHRFTF